MGDRFKVAAGSWKQLAKRLFCDSLFASLRSCLAGLPMVWGCSTVKIMVSCYVVWYSQNDGGQSCVGTTCINNRHSLGTNFDHKEQDNNRT